MAVLVLGVGYIGAKLVDDLLATGEDVVMVDNFFSTDPKAVERLSARPRCHLVLGNCGNPRVLATAFTHRSIDTVYLLAAQSSGHPRAAAPRYTETSNLLAPRVVLEAMRRRGVRTIVYGSSLRVYGDGVTPQTTEDAPYGLFHDLAHLGKCYVEKLLEMYAAQHGIRCVAARLGLVYGLSPVMKSDYRFMTAPNKFCRQLAWGDEISLHGGGKAVTGLVHVADAAKALRLLAAHQGFTGYVPVDVTTEWASIATVAAIAVDLARDRGLPGQPVEAGTDTLLCPSGRLASIGFAPTHPLRGALGEVLDYEIALRRAHAESPVRPAVEAQATR